MKNPLFPPHQSFSARPRVRCSNVCPVGFGLRPRCLDDAPPGIISSPIVKVYRAVVFTILVSACGRAEQKAAEARADSLQRVLREDSLQDARAQATATERQRAAADSVKAERARPRDLVLFSSTGLIVDNQAFNHYAFTLDSAADCVVHGHIEVQHDPSSKSDVQVLLVAADDYTNWVSNGSAQINALYKTPQQTATTLNVSVTESGTYNLVINNRFSFMTKKTVQGQVTVTCHGVEPRLAQGG